MLKRSFGTWPWAVLLRDKNSQRSEGDRIPPGRRQAGSISELVLLVFGCFTHPHNTYGIFIIPGIRMMCSIWFLGTIQTIGTFDSVGSIPIDPILCVKSIGAIVAIDAVGTIAAIDSICLPCHIVMCLGMWDLKKERRAGQEIVRIWLWLWSSLSSSKVNLGQMFMIDGSF